MASTLLQGKVIPWIKQHVEAAKNLPQARGELLASRADAAADKVFRIEKLSVAEKAQVRRHVRAAYWSVNANASWKETIEMFLAEHLLASVLMLFILAALSFPIDSLWPNLDRSSSATRIALMVSLGLSIFLYSKARNFLARMHAWMGAAFRLASAVFVLTLTVATDLRGRMLAKLNDFGVYEFKWRFISMQNVDVASVASFASITFTALFALTFIVNCLNFFIPRRMGPMEGSDVVACSHLLIALCDLVLLSDRAVRAQGEAADQAQGDGLRPYMASSVRTAMVRQLELIARLSEGSWRRALKTRDRAADVALNGIAEGIASAARRWKTVASTAGPTAILDLQEAFTQALLDAVAGNWSALAVEVSPSERLGRKAIRLLRRFLAIAFFACVAMLVATKPAGWMVNHNPVFDSIALLSAGLIALSIDPSIGELTGNAAKFVGSFEGKK
ncbi:hypothetical protein AB0950_17460 [Streptomyces sp. NPDC007189]|uniref:hypothetical protein n=1 Tax=Streptomyces sp. NPDC007189 TaxID=3154315 RepID=UPI003454CC27